MPKFISKPKVIDAEQFLPPNKIPNGVFNVYEGASGGVFSGQVRTIQGQSVFVMAGEWIVQEQDNPNRHYPIEDKYFRENFTPYETDKI